MKRTYDNRNRGIKKEKLVEAMEREKTVKKAATSLGVTSEYVYLLLQKYGIELSKTDRTQAQAILKLIAENKPTSVIAKKLGVSEGHVSIVAKAHSVLTAEQAFKKMRFTAISEALDAAEPVKSIAQRWDMSVSGIHYIKEKRLKK